MTYARVDTPEVACERSGRDDTVYFALLNFGQQAQPCELTIDLAPLNFSPQQGEMFGLSEIARNAPLAESSEGARARLTLKPDEAHIIKLQRRW